MAEGSRNKLVIMVILSTMLLVLFLLALHYVRGIQKLLYAEAKENISEIATQGAGRFTDAIQIRLGDAQKGALQLAYQCFSDTPDEVLEKRFLTFVENENRSGQCLIYSLAFPDGKAMREDGKLFDMKGELGFQRALEGVSSASEPFYSVYADLRILALYSPVVFGGQVRAVLRVAASIDCVYASFGQSSYRGHGQSYILSKTGRLIAGSASSKSNAPFSNFFDVLFEDLDAEDSVQALFDDMGQGKRGVTTLRLGKNAPAHLICYTPLGLDLDWYFVTIVPKKVILENSREVILRSTVLCGGVILLFFVGVFLFAHERSKNQAYILKLAFVDELTGLPNRNSLMEEKKTFSRKTQQSPYAMVVFDINNFKMVNESFGYKTGDKILCCAASVIEEEVDPDSELRARIGGDHFVLLLRYPNRDRVALEQRLRDLLNEISGMAEQNSLLSGSLSFACGVCPVAQGNLMDNRCYDYADIARKHVKGHSGSLIGFFEEEMLLAMQKEKEIELAMDKALADGEFQVYLQPKIDLQSEKLSGAEALVRWMRPGKGCVEPGFFIPLFERNGFVVKLDYAVMEQVCKQKRAWLDMGVPDQVISVNMSQYHLVHKDFVSTLETIAHKYNIAPETLEIEITESAFYSDAAAYTVMEAIKAAGFKLAMDDFGAGYSTLNMLRRMPLDVLKIDKQFLDESEASERTRTIISSIIHMAQSLGADVICEGVETLRQVEFLKGIGCKLVQGYFYSRPLPLWEFEEKYLGMRRAF
ncbi:MAG: EAL domain-containing protein [Bilophila sp.]